mmetsp:Transcript_43769/g.44242  ORF Transcript_43769/g.44242 Transcript_43769/m.44242 type:complete len:270 (-) Transcript_43769:457-1266(-)
MSQINEQSKIIMKAYHQFMMGTSTPERETADKKDKDKNEIPNCYVQTSCDTTSKQHEKRTWHLFCKFCSIVQNEWIDLDDQLYMIFSSILSIRSRIRTAEKVISTAKEFNPIKINWKNHGCRIYPLQSGTPSLQLDDINDALHHDILQNEKLLKHARKLLSNLTEVHQLLGRKAEVSYHGQDFKFETGELCNASVLIDEIINIYTSLSLELYRKQKIAERFFELSYECSSSPDQNLVEETSLSLQEWKKGSKGSCADLVWLYNIISTTK